MTEEPNEVDVQTTTGFDTPETTDYKQLNSSAATIINYGNVTTKTTAQDVLASIVTDVLTTINPTDSNYGKISQKPIDFDNDIIATTPELDTFPTYTSQGFDVAVPGSKPVILLSSTDSSDDTLFAMKTKPMTQLFVGENTNYEGTLPSVISESMTSSGDENTDYTGTFTSMATDITQTTTRLFGAENKDYDWVLPVVIVLALLVLLLFILVLLLSRIRQGIFAKSRCNHGHCTCETLQRINSENETSGVYRLNVTENPQYESDSGMVCAPDTRCVKPGSFIGTTNTKLSNKTRDRRYESYEMSTVSHMDDTSCLHTDDVNIPMCDADSPFMSSPDEDRGYSFDAWNTNDVEKEVVMPKDNYFPEYFPPDDFGHGRHQWPEKVTFYISKENDLEGGIENGVMMNSDSDKFADKEREVYAHTHKSTKFPKLEKSISYTSAGGMYDRDLKVPVFERQLSNQSAPAYAVDLGMSTNKCSQPMGKFDTMENLASSEPYDESDVSLDESIKYTETGDPDTSNEKLPKRHNLEMSMFAEPNKITHQLPTIILPAGGRIDFDDSRVINNVSFNHSISLENTSSTPRTLRKARANNPFGIEGVRTSFTRDLTRRCSAPNLFSSETQFEDQPHESSLFRTTSGYSLRSEQQHWLLPSLSTDSNSSRSWSSDFYELINDAGITDQATQKRVKKMIDDRYNLLFGKKYPELRSLYSSMESAEPDIDIKSDKMSVRKRKRRSNSRKLRNQKGDKCDRLKPPSASYSERRPPSTKREESAFSDDNEKMRPNEHVPVIYTGPIESLNQQYRHPGSNCTHQDNNKGVVEKTWDANRNQRFIRQKIGNTSDIPNDKSTKENNIENRENDFKDVFENENETQRASSPKSKPKIPFIPFTGHRLRKKVGVSSADPYKPGEHVEDNKPSYPQATTPALTFEKTYYITDPWIPSPVDPVYESIHSTQSSFRSSSKSSPTQFQQLEDSVNQHNTIYDNIEEVRNTTIRNSLEQPGKLTAEACRRDKEIKEITPSPRSSPPPLNVSNDNNKKRLNRTANIIKRQRAMTSVGLENSIPVKVRSMPYGTIEDRRRNRTSSFDYTADFLVSSSHIPLEHPVFEDDAGSLIDKDIRYASHDDLTWDDWDKNDDDDDDDGGDGDDQDDCGNRVNQEKCLSSRLPLQRMTSSTSYGDSIQISKV